MVVSSLWPSAVTLYPWFRSDTHTATLLFARALPMQLCWTKILSFETQMEVQLRPHKLCTLMGETALISLNHLWGTFSFFLEDSTSSPPLFYGVSLCLPAGSVSADIIPSLFPSVRCLIRFMIYTHLNLLVEWLLPTFLSFFSKHMFSSFPIEMELF